MQVYSFLYNVILIFNRRIPGLPVEHEIVLPPGTPGPKEMPLIEWLIPIFCVLWILMIILKHEEIVEFIYRMRKDERLFYILFSIILITLIDPSICNLEDESRFRVRLELYQFDEDVKKDE